MILRYIKGESVIIYESNYSFIISTMPAAIFENKKDFSLIIAQIFLQK